MEILQKLAYCIERGKVDKSSIFPPDMTDQEGSDELTQKAVDQGLSAKIIINHGLIPGMKAIGEKFRKNEVFVPEVLMAAKAMKTSMKHLQSFFQSGEIEKKGVIVLGSVYGDMHEIGKNLAGMMIEGNGWEVIDLGVNVPNNKFLESINNHPGCVVGLSALLTTTMVNMGKTVELIKVDHPDKTILVGGAPITQEFCNSIGAELCCSNPLIAIDYLNKL